jgi:transposase
VLKASGFAFGAGGQGMLVVETIARIRRERMIKGKTIKEIARDLKVSRNTVRRVLRSGETRFEYEREVQPRPKLGRWTDELDRLLADNVTKPAREQPTLIRLFEELRGRGHEDGYDAVRRYARRWAKERGHLTAAAFVPLSFAPGEAYQFDWSHEIVLLSGATVTVKVAHVRLCHSRMLFVRAYPRETQEMVFDAHDWAFALFKGTCVRGIYDNMKTAVETIFVGKERLYNRRFQQMCSHYLIDPVACTPASGWEKGRMTFAARKAGRPRPTRPPTPSSRPRWGAPNRAMGQATRPRLRRQRRRTRAATRSLAAINGGHVMAATDLIDRLRDRLPGHTRTQRLSLLRMAFSEVRLRGALHALPVELDAAGKPKPPSPSEQAFVEVGDVLLDEMASTLDG